MSRSAVCARSSESVTVLCGPRDKHNPDRVGHRHGTEAGSVTLGGRRVPVQRPRVRAADGSGELPVPAYQLFSAADPLGAMAMELMLAGLSTRRYGSGLEPVGAAVEQAASGTSKSAVSRRFVAATETALAAMLAAPLHELDLVAMMVDGVHFAEHCCVVALGVGIDGIKYPLALVEGSTENATLVTDLLVDLRERGLDLLAEGSVGGLVERAQGFLECGAKMFSHREQLGKVFGEGRAVSRFGV